MKKTRVAFCVLALSLTFTFIISAFAQTDPGSVGSYTKCTYTPPTNLGYSEAMVWYPCSGSGPFAATTLTSGFTGAYTDIAYLADHLVTHGYIVFAMTPTNKYGNNPTWTSAHKAGITMLKSENTRAATSLRPNPIKGKVNTAKLQVMGHSKGGGGTLLASASLGSSIKTAQALTPYMDYSYNLSTTKAKTNCITGTADTIAAPSAVVTMYNSLPGSIDRTLMYFQGLDHMVFTTDGNEPYKSRTTRYVTAFMKYQLDGNSSYQTYLYGTKHTEDVNAGWFYGYAHNKNY